MNVNRLNDDQFLHKLENNIEATRTLMYLVY